MVDYDKAAKIFYSPLDGAMFGLLLIAAAHPRIGWMPVEPPPQRLALAEWIMDHPADWNAASVIAGQALDLPIRERFALWRAAHEAGERLAPYRPNADVATLRAGLFHWHEMSPADRHMLLDLAVPLLHDEGMFRLMAKPLWDLTHDIALLRRAQPHNLESLTMLESLAVTNGRFSDYRQLRGEAARARASAFEARKRKASPGEILASLPPTLRTSDIPLVKSALVELARRPIEALPGVSGDGPIDFAVRQNLQPLDGLIDLARQAGTASDPNRARLALQLGNPELAASIELTSLTLDPHAWIRYRVERALFEAKRGDARGAEMQLSRAAAGSATVPIDVLAFAASIATNQHAEAAVERYRTELAARFGGRIAPEAWLGLCEKDICYSAKADVWAGDRRTLTITIETVQSDEVPPYVEIFSDDALLAEGPVLGRTGFALALTPGLHRIEIRVANPTTRNLMHRRVKVSEATF
ncbi:MAG TPA: hypothetical protein VEZ11_18405 [Thermoanaerobaculia bacterium]|nr:hypothetical protein [Thermoanaerobaculia bacterium]